MMEGSGGMKPNQTRIWARKDRHKKNEKVTGTDNRQVVILLLMCCSVSDGETELISKKGVMKGKLSTRP